LGAAITFDAKASHFLGIEAHVVDLAASDNEDKVARSISIRKFIAGSQR
jgi:hypothetical protein